MLDICLLGTGGMMPLPYRWLTAMMARCDGSSLLIDCGEGTKVALKEKGWSPKPIDVICFTHYSHAVCRALSKDSSTLRKGFMSCGSHQRTSRASSHDGQRRADGTGDIDRTEGTRACGERAAHHCAGASFPVKIHRIGRKQTSVSYRTLCDRCLPGEPQCSRHSKIRFRC